MCLFTLLCVKKFQTPSQPLDLFLPSSCSIILFGPGRAILSYYSIQFLFLFYLDVLYVDLLLLSFRFLTNCFITYQKSPQPQVLKSTIYNFYINYISLPKEKGYMFVVFIFSIVNGDWVCFLPGLCHEEYILTNQICKCKNLVYLLY